MRGNTEVEPEEFKSHEAAVESLVKRGYEDEGCGYSFFNPNVEEFMQLAVIEEEGDLWIVYFGAED